MPTDAEVTSEQKCWWNAKKKWLTNVAQLLAQLNGLKRGGDWDVPWEEQHTSDNRHIPDASKYATYIYATPLPKLMLIGTMNKEQGTMGRENARTFHLLTPLPYPLQWTTGYRIHLTSNHIPLIPVLKLLLRRIQFRLYSVKIIQGCTFLISQIGTLVVETKALVHIQHFVQTCMVRYLLNTDLLKNVIVSILLR